MRVHGHRGTTPLARPRGTATRSGCDGPTRPVLLGDRQGRRSSGGSPVMAGSTPPAIAGSSFTLGDAYCRTLHRSDEFRSPGRRRGARRPERPPEVPACPTERGSAHSPSAELRPPSALASRSTAPTTHTAIQPHAQTTEPVINAITRRPNPTAASTSVTTSTTLLLYRGTAPGRTARAGETVGQLLPFAKDDDPNDDDELDWLNTSCPPSTGTAEPRCSSSSSCDSR